MPPVWLALVLALISAGTTIYTNRASVRSAVVTTQRSIVNTSKKSSKKVVHVVTLGKK